MDTTKLQEIVKRINNFDCYYEFSDDQNVYDAGIEEETKLQALIHGLEKASQDYVIESLTAFGKDNFERYFKWD